MSKKSAKRRQCPAVGREITSADCGENRVSRYPCPAGCPHNPFAPGNYGQVLDLEDLVDPKCMARLRSEEGEDSAFARELDRARRDRSLTAMQACYVWHLFFKRDEAGLTRVERWEKAGLSGFKNDERVLLRAKMRMRPALIEVQRILDHECTEVLDLLSPDRRTFLIRDRSLASVAVRFVACVTWIFPLPHYWRLSGTAVQIPEMGTFEPGEIVRETVRHLGGPLNVAEIPLWLAEHLVRFDESLRATGHARRRQMFAGIDAEFGKAIYEMRAPFAECRDRLLTVAAVEPDDLADSERDEGFADACAWFDDSPQEPLDMSAGGRTVLGRVLLGQSQWRLEAMGGERFARLRLAFEDVMGARVSFTGERRDDLASKVAERQPKFDESLVPPRLLESAEKIVLASSRIPPLPQGLSVEDAQAQWRHAQDRAFLEDNIPALDGRTPREAAREPAMRPRLIRLLKQRVRATDERNLKSGRTDDVNWLLRELGANEILFDPPPWRPPPPETVDPADDEDFVEEVAGTEYARRPPAPPLPARALTQEEASERLVTAIDTFESAEEAITELEESGSTILEDVFELTAEMFDEKTSAFLTNFLLQAWFALVPRGHRAPRISFDGLAAAFDRQRDEFSRMVGTGSSENIMRYLKDSPQPAVAQMLALGVMEAERRAPKGMRPSMESQAMIIMVLKAVVDELDRALRSAVSAKDIAR